MIDAETVNDLVAQYEKHGWNLQRILLTIDPFTKLENELAKKFGPGTLHRSEIDAVWFSRPNGDKTSWEIRRLTGSPFALVRFVETTASDDEREAILSSAEAEIAANNSKPTEH